jgi:hypothetical protein
MKGLKRRSFSNDDISIFPRTVSELPAKGPRGRFGLVGRSQCMIFNARKIDLFQISLRGTDKAVQICTAFIFAPQKNAVALPLSQGCATLGSLLSFAWRSESLCTFTLFWYVHKGVQICARFSFAHPVPNGSSIFGPIICVSHKAVQLCAAFSLYHRDPAKRFLRSILQGCTNVHTLSALSFV